MTEKNSGKVILQAFLIIIAAFLAAGVLTALISMVTYNSDPAVSVSRIIVSVILLVIFRKYLDSSKAFTGLKYILPGLAIVIWNIIMNLMTGGQISLDWPVVICLGSFAPALFEETIFRGIAVSKMEQSGRKPMETLILTALLFGVLHLTNIAGMSLINVLVQAGYAFVIGLVFGAVFIVSHDIVTVILLHALIDISNNMFVPGGSATVVLLCVFGVLMAVMAVYAVYLVKTIEKEGSSK